jgi:hypothetical protein
MGGVAFTQDLLKRLYEGGDGSLHVEGLALPTSVEGGKLSVNKAVIW